MKNLIPKLEELEIEFVDLKLTDLAGALHHITFPLGRLPKAIKTGIGFDGSSLGGFRGVQESDLIARPDTSGIIIDPFYERPTATFFGDIFESDGKTPFAGCPRNILRKTLEHIRSSGIADKIIVLPEFEFHIFDEVEFFAEPTQSGYVITTGEEGLADSLENAYHISNPLDTTANLRSDIAAIIADAGIDVKYHHHEVGPHSQVEIEADFMDVSRAGDSIQLIKYIIKNRVAGEGLYATFMPKPLAGQAGNGMHLHIQLWKGEENIFASPTDENELSETALHFLGGIIKHARALCAFTNPSTNSYKRLMGGMEAPKQVFHSRANRKAAVRIPGYVRGAKDLRFEYRVPDAMANPYLALAGILLAGLDGTEKKLNPGPLIPDEPDPSDEKFPILPRDLSESLASLASDCEFLTRHGIFPEDVIKKWIKEKEKEIEEISSYPTPAEFIKYFAF
ncbi:type I glutamate--ammonia ligase [candidate division WOR-3 bacterium]|nr:type I glutamate--ammonia ligase [candidate division WOR-3 bacterium]